MKLSRTGLILAAAPAVVMLSVYYSLAIHMYQALGGWPTSIGERGFPPGLLLHTKIDLYLCGALICGGAFVAPVAAIVCGVNRHWRRFLPYLGLYVFSCVIAAGLMQFAPAPFLNWWWD